MDGFINLNKPSGITSRDAVNIVKRVLPKKTKIGHAGTLDPLAQGVLVVAIGSVTRLIEYAQEGRKTYRAEFLLGKQSETEDIESELIELVNPPIPTRQELEDAGKKWTGKILQKPPIYSALKINGLPAYKRARNGEDVELTPREITIYSASLLEYDYPVMKWELICSSGTYVRSWGRDVAFSAGSAAVMSALLRTRVGNFALEDSAAPEPGKPVLLPDTPEGTDGYALLPPLWGIGQMERVTISESQLFDLRLGRFILKTFTTQTPAPWAGLDGAGELKAILVQRPDGSVQALKNL